MRVDLEHVVMKIDVEGAEREVIDGCGDILQRIKAIVVEVHYPPEGNELAEISAVLQGAQFKSITIPGLRSSRLWIDWIVGIHGDRTPLKTESSPNPDN